MADEDLSWNIGTDDDKEKDARRKEVQRMLQSGTETTTPPAPVDPHYVARGVTEQPVQEEVPDPRYLLDTGSNVPDPTPTPTPPPTGLSGLPAMRTVEVAPETREQVAPPPSGLSRPMSKATLDKVASGPQVDPTEWLKTMGTGAQRGFLQGRQSNEVAKVMLEGQNATPEQVRAMIEAIERTDKHGPSSQLESFMRESEGGAWDTMKALARYGPTIIPEVFLQSFSGMAAPEVLSQGLATVGATALAGGVMGAPAGGVGAGPGAIGGATAGIPLGIGVMSADLAKTSKFVELLQGALQEEGLDLTDENVLAFLHDSDKVEEFAKKASDYGLAIGVIDALTGKAASSIVTKMGGRSALSKVGAAAVVEGGGGSGGEYIASDIIDDPASRADLVLEGVAGTATTPISVSQAAIQDRQAARLREQVARSQTAHGSPVEWDPEFLQQQEEAKQAQIMAELELGLEEQAVDPTGGALPTTTPDVAARAREELQARIVAQEEDLPDVGPAVEDAPGMDWADAWDLDAWDEDEGEGTAGAEEDVYVPEAARERAAREMMERIHQDNPDILAPTPEERLLEAIEQGHPQEILRRDENGDLDTVSPLTQEEREVLESVDPEARLALAESGLADEEVFLTPDLHLLEARETIEAQLQLESEAEPEVAPEEESEPEFVPVTPEERTILRRARRFRFQRPRQPGAPLFAEDLAVYLQPDGHQQRAREIIQEQLDWEKSQDVDGALESSIFDEDEDLAGGAEEAEVEQLGLPLEQTTQQAEADADGVVRTEDWLNLPPRDRPDKDEDNLWYAGLGGGRGRYEALPEHPLSQWANDNMPGIYDTNVLSVNVDNQPSGTKDFHPTPLPRQYAYTHGGIRKDVYSEIDRAISDFGVADPPFLMSTEMGIAADNLVRKIQRAQEARERDPTHKGPLPEEVAVQQARNLLMLTMRWNVRRAAARRTKKSAIAHIADQLGPDVTAKSLMLAATQPQDLSEGSGVFVDPNDRDMGPGVAAANLVATLQFVGNELLGADKTSQADDPASTWMHKLLPRIRALVAKVEGREVPDLVDPATGAEPRESRLLPEAGMILGIFAEEHMFPERAAMLRHELREAGVMRENQQTPNPSQLVGTSSIRMEEALDKVLATHDPPSFGRVSRLNPPHSPVLDYPGSSTEAYTRPARPPRQVELDPTHTETIADHQEAIREASELEEARQRPVFETMTARLLKAGPKKYRTQPAVNRPGRPGGTRTDKKGNVITNRKTGEPVIFDPVEPSVIPEKTVRDQIAGLIDDVPAQEKQALDLDNFLKGKEQVTQAELLDYVQDRTITLKTAHRQKTGGPGRSPRAAAHKELARWGASGEGAVLRGNAVANVMVELVGVDPTGDPRLQAEDFGPSVIPGSQVPFANLIVDLAGAAEDAATRGKINNAQTVRQHLAAADVYAAYDWIDFEVARDQGNLAEDPTHGLLIVGSTRGPRGEPRHGIWRDFSETLQTIIDLESKYTAVRSDATRHFLKLLRKTADFTSITSRRKPFLSGLVEWVAHRENFLRELHDFLHLDTEFLVDQEAALDEIRYNTDDASVSEFYDRRVLDYDTPPVEDTANPAQALAETQAWRNEMRHVFGHPQGPPATNKNPDGQLNPTLRSRTRGGPEGGGRYLNRRGIAAPSGYGLIQQFYQDLLDSSGIGVRPSSERIAKRDADLREQFPAVMNYVDKWQGTQKYADLTVPEMLSFVWTADHAVAAILEAGRVLRNDPSFQQFGVALESMVEATSETQAQRFAESRPRNEGLTIPGPTEDYRETVVLVDFAPGKRPNTVAWPHHGPDRDAAGKHQKALGRIRATLRKGFDADTGELLGLFWVVDEAQSDVMQHAGWRGIGPKGFAQKRKAAKENILDWFDRVKTKAIDAQDTEILRHLAFVEDRWKLGHFDPSDPDQMYSMNKALRLLKGPVHTRPLTPEELTNQDLVAEYGDEGGLYHKWEQLNEVAEAGEGGVDPQAAQLPQKTPRWTRVLLASFIQSLVAEGKFNRAIGVAIPSGEQVRMGQSGLPSEAARLTYTQGLQKKALPSLAKDMGAEVRDVVFDVGPPGPAEAPMRVLMLDDPEVRKKAAKPDLLFSVAPILMALAEAMRGREEEEEEEEDTSLRGKTQAAVRRALTQ